MRRSPLLHTFIWLVLLLSSLALASSGAVAQASGALSLSVSSSARGIVTTSLATMGCGKPAPIPPGTSANETLRSGGLTRRYRLHVPHGYLSTRSTPLVLSFHGHGSMARIQEQMTGFSRLADQQDFLVAYPQGTVGPDGKTGWATGPRKDPTVDDLRFVSDLLTRLQMTLCIDPQRIYATGFSNGGAMTALLACRMAGRIAAFAPVSGSYFPVSAGCHTSRPAPILEIHGTSDSIVPYDGSLLLHLPPIPAWLSGWARRDGCASQPEVFFQRGNVTGERWIGCQAGAAIVHYRIEGGTHTWPNFRSAPNAAPRLNATDLIWSFFQSHALPSGHMAV